MHNRVQQLHLHLANRHTCNINHRLLPSCPLKDTHTRRSNHLRHPTRVSTILSPTLVSQTCINSTISRQAKQQPWLLQPRQGSRVTATRCLRPRWLDHRGWGASLSKMSEHRVHHRKCRTQWDLYLRRSLKITECPKVTWDTLSEARTARALKQ